MDQARERLSCPGRVQDWLGAAADQIETLLLVPQPSLSGSDEAIGALRIKRERPSRMTGPYNLRPTTVTPIFGTGTSSTARRGISSSVSLHFNESLYADKSFNRCENCTAEKGSRCSRDFPSCTRCARNGMVCSYTEGIPTGRRKPRGRRRKRSRRIGEEQLGLPVRSLLEVRPASENPALSLLETSGVIPAVSYHVSGTSSLPLDSEYLQPPPDQYSNFLDPVSVWGGKKSDLEDASENPAGSRIQGGPTHLTPISLQSRSPPHATSVSLATTPFSSTLGSRSTSQSSGADSWPITPEQAVGPDAITSSRASSDSYTTPSAPREELVVQDAEDSLAHMEEVVDLYLLSRDRHRPAHDAVPSTELQDGTFPDDFLEELFEEGDAAKRLVELQRYS
jgi:hypothetical protein